MTSCKLMLNGEEIAAVGSAEDLKAFLREVRKEFQPRNPIIDIVHNNGNHLSVGISPKGCCANYMDASFEPPYYSSLGNPSIKRGEGVVVFKMSRDDHATEISLRSIIPFRDLLRTATAFFMTGTRPENIITWEAE